MWWRAEARVKFTKAPCTPILHVCQAYLALTQVWRHRIPKLSKDGGKIDAITASTITSRAFLRAINNAYAAYKNQHVDGASGATQQAAAEDNSNVESN